MPESPYYLVKCGKNEAARKSLVRLQKHCIPDNEIDRLVQEIQTTVELDIQNRTSVWVILDREFQKPFCIMIGRNFVCSNNIYKL